MNWNAVANSSDCLLQTTNVTVIEKILKLVPKNCFVVLTNYGEVTPETLQPTLSLTNTILDRQCQVSILQT